MQLPVVKSEDPYSNLEESVTLLRVLTLKAGVGWSKVVRFLRVRVGTYSYS